ncbi:hypothetical protein VULLAG_LOCUS13903 [Vulpes lagopus]
MENPEFICLRLPDKQGFCLKSGGAGVSQCWGEARRKQLADRKPDASLMPGPRGQAQEGALAGAFPGLGRWVRRGGAGRSNWKFCGERAGGSRGGRAGLPPPSHLTSQLTSLQAQPIGLLSLSPACSPPSLPPAHAFLVLICPTLTSRRRVTGGEEGANWGGSPGPSFSGCGLGMIIQETLVSTEFRALC